MALRQTGLSQNFRRLRRRVDCLEPRFTRQAGLARVRSHHDAGAQCCGASDMQSVQRPASRCPGVGISQADAAPPSRAPIQLRCMKNSGGNILVDIAQRRYHLRFRCFTAENYQPQGGGAFSPVQGGKGERFTGPADKRAHAVGIPFRRVELEQNSRVVVALHREPRDCSSNSVEDAPRHGPLQVRAARALKSGKSTLAARTGDNRATGRRRLVMTSVCPRSISRKSAARLCCACMTEAVFIMR